MGEKEYIVGNQGDPLLGGVSLFATVFSIQKVKNRGLVLENHVLLLHIVRYSIPFYECKCSRLENESTKTIRSILSSFWLHYFLHSN